MKIVVMLCMNMLGQRMTDAIVNISVFWKLIFLSMMAWGAMSSTLGMSTNNLRHVLTNRVKY